MTKNTVYVIGAGASYEANLPTGNQLKKVIATLLNISGDFRSHQSGDHDIREALLSHSRHDRAQMSSYLNECQHIRKNMPLAISIDNFIDSERDNEKVALCGKLAIIKSILKAEKDSKLYQDNDRSERDYNFSKLEDTWYLAFFRTLTENCNREDLRARFEKVTLIVFNYDRCIEHFLFNAISRYYRLESRETAELIDSLNIIHPYGSVGALNWQAPQSHTSVKFGGEVRDLSLLDHAQRIRTFTEGANSEYMENLIKSMRFTNRLIFLGFAFHQLNMDLIGGESDGQFENPNDIECFATAFETSKSDQVAIENSIRHLYKNQIVTNIEDTTCSQLFRDYSKSLGYC